MNRIFVKIASMLAFVIGAMSVVAGGSVLRGRDPGYHVIDWLPGYNVAAGAASALVIAALIWRQSRAALPAALAVFGAHSLVFVILLAVYRQVAARQSIMAMTFRMIVWLAILLLMLAQARRDGRTAPA